MPGLFPYWRLINQDQFIAPITFLDFTNKAKRYNRYFRSFRKRMTSK